MRRCQDKPFEAEEKRTAWHVCMPSQDRSGTYKQEGLRIATCFFRASLRMRRFNVREPCGRVRRCIIKVSLSIGRRCRRIRPSEYMQADVTSRVPRSLRALRLAVEPPLIVRGIRTIPDMPGFGAKARVSNQKSNHYLGHAALRHARKTQVRRNRGEASRHREIVNGRGNRTSNCNQACPHSHQ